MESEFNALLTLGQTVLDNSNGVFSVFNNIVGELVTTGTASAISISVTTSPTVYHHRQNMHFG